MKYGMCLLIALLTFPFTARTQDAVEILEAVDANMTYKTSITESEMVIHGRRKSRTVVSRSYGEGTDKSFTEYLAPAREEGTKMLKLEDRLWIYSPATDRIIQLSGHMLRQSVMGSDLSYEDMMEDRELTDLYDAEISGKEDIDGRKTWILHLTAKVEDVSYPTRKIWVDQERYVPLREELFAKSGQKLKTTVLSDVRKQGDRWYPMKMNYKDELKAGKGTDFIVRKIEFDRQIDEDVFNKGALKRF
jgi:outer membrane lipoprotein-sorting protein